MKILYVHIYDPRFGMGGAERLALDLACGVKDYPGQEVVFAVNSSELSDVLAKRGIPVREIYWSKFKSAKTLRAIESVRDSFRPDLAHAHHRYATFLLDMFFKKKFWVVHTEHVLRRDKKFLFRYGHFATAVADSVRDNLIKYYHVPAGRVIAIPNATPERKVDPARLAEIEKRYSQDGRTPVACIGRLEEQKGHRYLIEAVSLLPPALKGKLRIFLLGDGSMETELKRQAKQSGVEACFAFVGHTDRVPEFLAFSHFLVLPSLWEGMPLSILEAYGAGKPVVATDIPGSRELVERKTTGFLVPPKDTRGLAAAMGRMINRPEQTQAMGVQAYQAWESRYSFRQMVARYLDFYRKVVSEHAIG